MNPNEPHHVFGPQQTAHLVRALERAGEGAELHIYPRGTGGPLLVVCDAAGKQADPVNESYICPGDPRCPR